MGGQDRVRLKPDNAQMVERENACSKGQGSRLDSLSLSRVHIAKSRMLGKATFEALDEGDIMAEEVRGCVSGYQKN